MRLVKIFGMCLLLMFVMPLMTAVLGSVSPSERRNQEKNCSPSDGAASSAWSVPMGAAYRVTAQFGPRVSPITGAPDMHTGIDLASPAGDAPVLAATAGEVVRIENLGNRSYGLWVEINHGGGTTTCYAHLSSVSVRVGDRVNTGQQIAVEGKSGGVTGPHLHFEIRHDGEAVDPAKELMERFGFSFDGVPGITFNGSRAITADDVAAFLPNPQGVDQSGSLTEEQIANATAIVETGQKLGLPPKAWAIALMTALQESTLGADKSTTTPNSDVDVGIFQQRAKVGWYADGLSVEQNTAILNDVRYAAATFYQGHDMSLIAYGLNPEGAAGPPGYHLPGLIDIKDWMNRKDLGEIAQAVQKSDFPRHYTKHEATVAALLPRINTGIGSYECAPAAEGIPSNGTAGEQVAAYAMTQIGVPYSWGGGDETGPTKGFCCSPGGKDGSAIVGFDCSGLVLWAWSKLGVKLPHESSAQQRMTTPVAKENIQAGDLLFFPGHVGIADGKGGMIEAPRPGLAVRVTPDVLNDPHYGPLFTGAGRPSLPNKP